ncbi:hypothetical protein SMD44_00003 [Streptomyces alboflavus]|uniref:Transposase n=2 Tax=Streptomyces alboflavus TaxID=67267 RepID=A0A1Z1W2G6_9ACTN|nr:hypothetical protein SMD44_00003 [Streptomyces alboflavus]
MRAQLMVLDRDPRVVGLAGRPVRLLWRDGRGQVRSWVPQLFARYADGGGLLADCPSRAEASGERARRAGEAVSAACADIGWTYRRLEPLDEVLAANLKWLAGYRHPRNRGRAGLVQAVWEAFACPRPLIEGVTSWVIRLRSSRSSSMRCGVPSWRCRWMRRCMSGSWLARAASRARPEQRRLPVTGQSR